ncbi:protein ORF2 [Cyprinid herpesvirus 1]|uniref:Protein ORF2 n=1 Tax=Cyprinid herpesvirus 1 TaxID=317858 RepID=K7PBZ0_9VIRU|nr:protein ORF2 [Cyprinid herpesvirus 1]YP_007003817.1 protein ORF2 [Cyprinid herpesvirus 1]AFJ20315.1 protein ORF2 [Cyprinid herpesvirus 1]AFJ20448.1 protein ORF2 [Cyprinid herpesvirus 1]
MASASCTPKGQKRSSDEAAPSPAGKKQKVPELGFTLKPYNEEIDMSCTGCTLAFTYDHQAMFSELTKPEMAPEKESHMRLFSMGRALYRLAQQLITKDNLSRSDELLEQLRLELLNPETRMEDALIDLGSALDPELENTPVPESTDDNKAQLRRYTMLRSVALACMRVAVITETATEKGDPRKLDGTVGGCPSAGQVALWLGRPVVGGKWFSFDSWVDIWYRRISKDSFLSFSSIYCQGRTEDSTSPTSVSVHRPDSTEWTSIHESPLIKDQWRRGKDLVDYAFMAMLRLDKPHVRNEVNTLKLGDLEGALRKAKLMHIGDGVSGSGSQRPRWTDVELEKKPKLQPNQRPLISDVHYPLAAIHQSINGVSELSELGHGLMTAAHMNVRVHLLADRPLTFQQLSSKLYDHYRTVVPRDEDSTYQFDITKIPKDRMFEMTLTEANHGLTAHVVSVDVLQAEM